MRSSILLSGKRDTDLIALYKKVGKAEFTNLVKDSLRSVVRRSYRLEHPFEGCALQGEVSDEIIRVSLVLTSEKDEDVRTLLSHILPGKITAFIKQVLRFYLGPITVLSGYMDSTFSSALQKIEVPVQVFAIGNFDERTPVRKQKPRKPRSIQKPKEPSLVISRETEKEEDNNTKIHTQPIFQNTGIMQPFEEKPVSINNENSTENTSEEDEILALLDGLLG